MRNLNGIRVAILAMDGFEEIELVEPLRALRDAGARVDVVSKKREPIQGFRHYDKAGTMSVDRTFDEIRPEDYDALMLPGGALNADNTRMEPRVRQMIQAFDRASKPIAAICHAPWELISAGVVRERKLTSWPTIQDDIRNAGGNWVDQDAVVDENWVTSRGPQDMQPFEREMLALFARVPAGSHR